MTIPLLIAGVGLLALGVAGGVWLARWLPRRWNEAYLVRGYTVLTDEALRARRAGADMPEVTSVLSGRHRGQLDVPAGRELPEGGDR